jgi:hypothetical protein
MNTFYKQKLLKILNECDKHLLRMNSASKKMSSFMPLTSTKYENLTEDEIEHIDQFLFRFSKLQDAMGQKLFKSFLVSLDEDIENLPFVDILNRLEKIKILEDINIWRELREYRNELSHNYDDDPLITSNIINNLYCKKEKMSSIYQKIKSRIELDREKL